MDLELNMEVHRKREEMSNNFPVFPIPEESYHFTDADYGSYPHSDPQIHNFQVLVEARKHRNSRSINLFNFKLQKTISKDESKKKKNKKNQKNVKWWQDAILYFRKRWPQSIHHRTDDEKNDDGGISSVQNRRRAYAESISSPIYLTESRSGSSTPCRRQWHNSPALTPARKKGEVEIPYVSLRELNMEPQFYKGVPIYLVT